MISLQTSNRFDNCHYAGDAKDSDKQEVALHRRQTTTKRSQRGEHGQLPHPWAIYRILFISHLFGSARAAESPSDGPGLVTTRWAAGDQLTNAALVAWFG